MCIQVLLECEEALSLYIRGNVYLEAVRDVEFGRRDAHQIIHHDHDGDEHGKVADGGAHLCKAQATTRSETRLVISYSAGMIDFHIYGIFWDIEPMEMIVSNKKRLVRYSPLEELMISSIMCSHWVV